MMPHAKYYPGFEQLFIETEKDVFINTYVGGTGEDAVLLLHGHPETLLIWRDIAPVLAKKYRVVMTDLRGYGDSSKPCGEKDHSTYSKRVMANDQLRVMEHLGIKRFHIAGHDRGARVAYRLIKDDPERALSCTMMDILPTNRMYADTGKEFAEKYWHWFFYIQPAPFPERLLSAEPALFIRTNMQKKTGASGAKKFPEDVMQDYIRCFSDPACVHAIME
ncbi:alpha/beta hydrolase, partial [Christensenellaceae bacterium OttesenSCG-928-M15]|nr:alpha/beta hydrolase [Christensenellaceae bacterium OttesenSCG-928-M15]